MAHYDMIAPTEPVALPRVRSITTDDVWDALKLGLDDFRAMPSHVVFLCLIYPVVGVLLFRMAFGYEIVPLLYPLAAGFALLGPIAAIGLYELSRRREAGLDTSWRHAFDVLHSPSRGDIAALSALLLLTFSIWIAIANAIYVTDFGYAPPAGLREFARNVLTTPEGHHMLVLGNLIGIALSILVLAISVVSFPLLLDRHVGVATAILTSVTAVVRNPLPMALWALIVAAGLGLGFAFLFFGLAVTIPVLGHATWHLYRKVVEPDAGPRPPVEQPERGRHYAAHFPASLFSSTREPPRKNKQE